MSYLATFRLTVACWRRARRGAREDLDGIASHCRAVKTLEAFGTRHDYSNGVGFAQIGAASGAPYCADDDGTVPLRTEKAQRFDATQYAISR